MEKKSGREKDCVYKRTRNRDNDKDKYVRDRIVNLNGINTW